MVANHHLELMRWITREHVHVDRVACPWLIQRFVDHEAEFLFVPSQEVERLAKMENAIPFDIPNAELGHHGDKCSFDAIVRKYGLTDEALLDVAAIVRAADTDTFEDAPESVGLEAISSGATMITRDDHETIEKSMFIYDSLYANCRLRILKEEHSAELDGMSRSERRSFLRERLLDKGKDK
jgi:hypothetical protein